jgi:glycosyltransferase involved in cell wall biosynthesis
MRRFRNNEKPTMKLYAICLVKNEDDIIAQTLDHAAAFCEKIFVLDNGSTDSTWDLVCALSQVNPRIVPFGQTFNPYRRSLRSEVYYEVRSELSEDDWWLVLDADEFLAEDPQPVIARAVRRRADVIRSWQISFFYTEVDLKAWEEGKDSKDRPIVDRRRFYLINWQERRLFRNRRDLQWGDGNVPKGLGKEFSQRILNSHYPLRDPEQIQKRLSARFGHPTCFRHVTTADWRQVIRDSRGLVFRRDGDPWRFTVSGLAQYYLRRFVKRNRRNPSGTAVGRSGPPTSAKGRDDG